MKERGEWRGREGDDRETGKDYLVWWLTRIWLVEGVGITMMEKKKKKN